MIIRYQNVAPLGLFHFLNNFLQELRSSGAEIQII